MAADLVEESKAEIVAALPRRKGSLPRGPVPLTKRERELRKQVKSAVGGVSEAISILGNEPSLGLFRLQEHIRKSVPPVVECKEHFVEVGAEIKGACYDADYAESTIAHMKTVEQFSLIQEHLNKAIALKDGLNKGATNSKGELDSIIQSMAYI